MIMKVIPRAHTIGTVLYTLPFLGTVVFSLCCMWAGNEEMIVTGVALAPAVLFLFGVRWCRYVVATFSAMSFLAISLIPFLRGTEGRYFWVIWAPIWLVAGFATSLLLIRPRQTALDAS
jgi:hypothetical protein